MLSLSIYIAFVAVLSAGFLLQSETVLAQDTGAQTIPLPETPTWIKQVGGIVAIPATIIGIVYSWFLIKKSRLEIRRIQFEISEPRDFFDPPDPVTQQVVQPLITNRNVQFLILRFIVLYLVLTAWGLVEDVSGLITNSVFLGVFPRFGFDVSKSWAWIPFLIWTSLPSIGYWLLFFVIGWPLFKDVNETLGLRLKDFFKLRSEKSG